MKTPTIQLAMEWTDIEQIARILDNDLSHGLYDDATALEYAHLLGRLRAAIRNGAVECGNQKIKEGTQV